MRELPKVVLKSRLRLRLHQVRPQTNEHSLINVVIIMFLYKFECLDEVAKADLYF